MSEQDDPRRRLERELDAMAWRVLDMARAMEPPPLFSPFREAGRRYAASRAAARLAEKDDRDRWIADVKRRLGLVGIGERGYRIETEVRFREKRLS